MPATRITDVQRLAPFMGHLRLLGYTTTDQLAGAARVSGEPLARFLNLKPGDLEDLVRAIPHQEVRFAAAAPASRRLGVRLDRVPRSSRAPLMALGLAAPLPPKISLIAQMQPVRDQGSRGTCVAHAATAAAEHYWRSQGKTIDLSRQFLYWACKQNDGHPDEEGTWIGVAMPQLTTTGCCLEHTWPYSMREIPGNESQGPPPASALAEAPTYAIPGFRELSPTAVQDIKGELAEGRCVAFSIPVFNSWYQNDEVTRTGEIVNPIPGEGDVGGHAMCFVGYEDQSDAPGLGGGRFYLRNSWDANWATEPVLGTAGYGTIPYSYIARLGTEAYSIQ